MAYLMNSLIATHHVRNKKMLVGSSSDNSLHGYDIQFISYAGSCNASEVDMWKAYTHWYPGSGVVLDCIDS